ncbi:UDP-N-acetylglucosamine 2-epimerase [Streptococcus sp. DD12]|nr:UDP-N-acetylglucosamine 2-epimerase [Streptococcus sp. DD12]
MAKLDQDPQIQLDIVATAMHMEEIYGLTYRVIEADGFKLTKKIPLGLTNTSKAVAVAAISRLQLALSELFESVTYDLIIILGDRYEMLAVANTALLYNVPVCHLHGGEKTLGNFDEYIRHAITKMSHLHLTATEDYRKRVIQMGEAPERVINTGALGVENALNLPRLSLASLEEGLDIPLKDYYVVLFHPVTLDGETAAAQQIATLLKALQGIDQSLVFIGANSDTGSDVIMAQIREFVAAATATGRYLFSSLTTQEYQSLVAHSKGLIGNSSSGLIEVPSLNRPTLNIGDRQKGRLHGPSVLDVPVDEQAISQGIAAMAEVTDFSNPYFQPQASQKAYLAIKEALKEGLTTAKDFYDIKGEV